MTLKKSNFGIIIFLMLTSFYPLVANIPLILGVNSTPISMAYRLSYLILSIVVLLWATTDKKLELSKGGIALIVFWILYSFRMFYDLTIRDIKIFETDSYFYLFGIGGCFIPAVALLITMPAIDKQVLLKWYFFFSVLVNLNVVSQILLKYGFSPELYVTRVYLGEDTNIFNPIGLSREGALLAIFSIFFILFDRYKVFIKHRLVLYFGFVLGLITLLVGASRGPLASFFVVLILILLYHTYVIKKTIKYRVKIILVIAGFSTGFLKWVIPFVNEVDLNIVERVTETQQRGIGDEIRMYQWQAAWSQIKSSPLFGERMVETFANHSPHNLFIEIALSLGIVGSFLFLVMMWYFFKNFIIALKYRDVMVVFFFLNIAYFLFGLTGLNIPTGWQFWAIFSLNLAYFSNFDNKQRLINE